MKEKSLLLIQQENLELKQENEALKITVTKMLDEITRLRDVTLPPNPNKISLTSEQRIIDEQIRLLEIVSMSRALDLDETRTLDLFIKNKRMLDENKPIEVDYTKVPDGSTESDLMRIAGNVEEPKFKKRSKPKTGTKDPVA